MPELGGETQVLDASAAVQHVNQSSTPGQNLYDCVWQPNFNFGFGPADFSTWVTAGEPTRHSQHKMEITHVKFQRTMGHAIHNYRDIPFPRKQSSSDKPKGSSIRA